MVIPGTIQNFIDGVDLLRPYGGGTLSLEAHGMHILAINVSWSDLSESQQDTLNKKGWYAFVPRDCILWSAEG